MSNLSLCLDMAAECGLRFTLQSFGSTHIQVKLTDEVTSKVMDLPVAFTPEDLPQHLHMFLMGYAYSQRNFANE